jgi:hypothetical protein
MIDLARALGLRVVAEGVADERTWRLLADAGCDVAQGWFFARPMPGDEFAGWLARHRPRVGIRSSLLIAGVGGLSGVDCPGGVTGWNRLAGLALACHAASRRPE